MKAYLVKFRFLQLAALQILDPEYLCVSILSLKVNNDSISEGFSDEFQKIINSIHLINYQQNEMKQITKEIFTDHISYFDVLEHHHFNLPINNQFLKFVSQSNDAFNSHYSFISQCILQYYLSWMLMHYRQETIDFKDLIFNLILISQPFNNPIFSKIQNLSLSAFYHMFRNINIQILKIEDFTFLCENLKIYYSIANSLPQQKYNLLSQIANSIFSQPLSQNKDEITAYFFEYIISLLNNHGKTVPSEIIQQILALLLPQLSQLDTKTLLYFKCLSNYIQNAPHIYDVFATSIYREISQKEPFRQLRVNHSTETEIKKEILPPLSAPEVALRFWDEIISPKWFNLKENVHIETTDKEKIEKKQLIPSDLKVILDLIIESTHNKHELAMNMLDSFSFLASNLTEENKFAFDSCYIFFYICVQLKQFVRDIDIVNILINKPFFDPTVTIFNNKIDDKIFDTKEECEKESDFDIINSIRSSIVDIAIIHVQSFEQFLLKWIQYPHLFIEIIGRIMRNSHFHIDTTNVNIISRALMKCSVYYQQLHYTDSEHTLLIESVRRSIFLLISQILQVQNASLLLFSNAVFVSFFLSFLFEVPIRSFILTHFLNFLTKNCIYQDFPTDSIESIINQIIQISSRMFPEDKFIVIVTDLLQTLTEALIHQRDLTSHFEQICTPLFSSLNQLDNSELSRNYILVCIQFFAITADKLTINNLQISELENSIHIAFNDVIPQQLTNKLIQMIAGEVSPSLSPTFIIRQPKALTLFLKISLKDNKLLDTINFLDQLCQFSALNCQSCHLSEFDHYLIDLIVEMKNSPVEIITAILTLFQRIASVMSSVSIVQRFISLLSPINGRQIPKNLSLYLKTINNIVSTASRLPVASLPLTENSAKIEIQGLNASDISSGFTFVFWINIDYSFAQYRPMILTITDSKGKILRWFLSATNLFCTQRSNEAESNGKVDSNLPISTWTFVAVTYNVFSDEHIVEMRTIFGSEEAKPLEFCEMPLQAGPLTLTVGGVAPKSVHSDLITRLGAFGLFKSLYPEQISSIYEMGPRLTGLLSETPFFFYQLDEVNDSLALKTKSAMPNIEAKMSFASIRFNTTFSDILINFCKVEILLPLFSELDMPMENGEIFPNLVKTIIELLGNTLAISNRAQEMFRRASGFAIVSHLLLSSSQENIDYSLYLQFFTLMQSFTSENLQIDVLKNILLNINIWIRTDAENHIRIIRHWARVIFPSLKYLIFDLISFQDILFMLRSYYYYEPVNEEEDNIQLKRCVGLNVAECRQLMCNIATSLASESMTVEDFDCLASHCITCVETRQIPDLLRLLKSLIICHPSPLLRITSQIDVIYFLYSLFNKHSNEINCLIIENVVAFHKYGILKPDSLQIHIIRLQNQLSPSVINDDLFKCLVNMMITNYPEILPICSMIAISLNELISLWFVQQLQQNANIDYFQHFSWCLWPVILCYHSSQNIKIEMMKFFAKLPDSQWQNIFIMIIYIGFILEEDSSEMQKMFLRNLIEFGISNNESNYQIFYKLCSFYLFSPTKSQTISIFSSVFKNSVFGINSKYNDLNSIPSRTMSSFVRHPVHINFGANSPPSLKTSMNDNNCCIDKSCSIDNISISTCSSTEHQRIMIKSKSMNLNSEETTTKNSSSSSSSLNQNDKKENIIVRKQKSDSLEPNSSLQFILDENKKLSLSSNFKDKYKISNIFDTINSTNFPSSPYHFSIRFDKEMKWEDIELARKFVEYFLEHKNKQFLEPYLIILAFIGREDPLFTQTHLATINLTTDEVHQFEGALFVINHHLQSSNLIEISNTNIKHIKEIEEGSFHCIENHKFTQQHEINRMCINLSYRLKELIKLSSKKLNIKNYPTLVYCQDQLVVLSHLNNKQMIDNKRKWMRLWRCLAIDHAPWDCNTHGEAHFKRDNTFCLYFCPFKIKRNWKFDDHKGCFFTKEQQLSSESATELLIKEDLEHRKSKYGKKESFQLLEINDNDIDNVYSDQYIAYMDRHTTKKGKKDDNSFMKKLIFKVDCEYITPTTTTKKEINGVFFLTREFIRIIFADDDHRPPKTIYLSEIHSLFFRRSYHRPNSIEIFTINGRCYYIHFKDHNSLAIIKKIASLPLPNAVNVQTVEFFQFFQKKSLTEKWINGEISNFEYIMHLNVMSGRTFNDLTQYPLFPWIIANYEEKEPTFIVKDFRDLTKPIGALSNERLKYLLTRYEEMKQKNIDPYLYDSGSSYMMAACSYLLRLEPFTSEFVSIMNGKPMKQQDFFNSVEESYKSVTTNFDDYRELIPEFFFMPEVFLNLNHYDFKNEENSKDTGDVVLPKWAESAEEFVYQHRKALESKYVSSILNNWIDLIWGVKQRGENAVDSDNVFNPFMYDDIWNDADSFKENRSKIENCLLYRGQVPPQLFKEKHPVKQPKPNITYFDKLYIITIDNNNNNIANNNNTNNITNSNNKIIVSFSHVDMNVKEHKYKITVVTVDGMMRSYTIDFSKLVKKSSKHMIERTQTQPKKPPQRLFTMNSSVSDSSISQKAQPDTSNMNGNNSSANNDLAAASSIISSPSADNLGTNNVPVSSIKDVTMTVSTQKIVGLSDHKVDQFDHPNSVASLMKDKVAVISSVTNKVMFIDFRLATLELMPCQLSEAVAVATGKDLLAVAGNDAVLNIFKSENVIGAAAAASFSSMPTSTVSTPSPSSSSSISAASQPLNSSTSNNNNNKNNDNMTIGLNNELFNKEEIMANVTPIISMPSYRDSISCCCLSQTFFVSVIGTRDGSLIINSLNKGSTVRVIDLEGEKPCMVTITPGWGFIVCYATKLMCGRISHYIYVFNINGIKLRKRNIGFEICSWAHSTSPEGFDYMLISDEHGKLFSFEVFYLKIKDRFIFRCHSPVSSLEYLPDLHAVLIVTRDGRIMFKPYHLY